MNSEEAIETPPASTRIMPWVVAGPLITFVGAVSYFLVFAMVPSLRDIPWVNIPLVLLGCGLSFVGVKLALAPRTGWIRRIGAGLGLVFSIGITGLFLAYIGYLSFQMPKISQNTSALETLPTFQSTDQHGASFQSADLDGQNLVLVFYRGHW